MGSDDGSQSDCRLLTTMELAAMQYENIKQAPTDWFELGNGEFWPFIQRSDEPVSICR